MTKKFLFLKQMGRYTHVLVIHSTFLYQSIPFEHREKESLNKRFYNVIGEFYSRPLAFEQSGTLGMRMGTSVTHALGTHSENFHNRNQT